jgi:hypothetical protein
VKRLVARLWGLAAFVGFVGTLGIDVLTGTDVQHNETLLLDPAS